MDETLRSDMIARMRQASTHELLSIWNDYDLEEWTEDAFSAITGVLNERRVSPTGVEFKLPTSGWICSCGADNVRGDEYCRSCGLNLQQQLTQETGTAILTEKSYEPDAVYVTPGTFAHTAFGFKGRISVGTFWLSVLCLIGVAGLFVGILFFLQSVLHFSDDIAGILLVLGMAPLLVSSLALQVKRFHDIGRSGFAFVWHFCPGIGNLVCLYFFLKEGEMFSNQYGADPLAHKRKPPVQFNQLQYVQPGVWPPPVQAVDDGHPTLDEAYVTPRTLAHLLFSFNGRILRATFWLFTAILGAAAFLIYVVVGLLERLAVMTDTIGGAVIVTLTIPILYALLAIHTKRWHDIGKSGSWNILSFMVGIGTLIAVAHLGFVAGEPGDNQYGANPAEPAGSLIRS